MSDADLMNKLGMKIPEELRAPEAGPRTKLVLIIDDELSIIQLLVRFFKKDFPEVSVETAQDGFEAGLKVQNLTPDLILLDLKLPGQDGFEVCKKIKNLPHLANAKVVAITGVMDSWAHRRILKLGAAECLLKPFDFKEFKEKMKFYLEPKSKPNSEREAA